jgi:heme oxygenase-like protein
VAFRGRLELAFEQCLRVSVSFERVRPERVPSALRSIAREDKGPSLSRFVERKASLGQVREFLIHRSAYHLKEADPHSLAIPRLAGPAKAALAEIQVDEYGGGDPARMHSFLFAKAIEGVGLDPGYGAYLERIPGPTLATVNLMSMFGLHRRMRGALVGHLALFELTSTLPNRRYGNGLRRLGFGAETTTFFDEHVEADAVHEAIASKDMAGSLVEAEPELTNDVIFGARALQVLEQRASEAMLGAWERDATSLLADPKEHDADRVA